MKLSDFNFDLPKELIASEPASPRDAAKLLVIKRDLEDRHIYDLPSQLKQGDILVFNNTKVLPVRLKGKRGEAAIDVTLFEQLSADSWAAFIRPAKRVLVQQQIIFAEDFYAEVMEKEEGKVLLRFNVAAGDFFSCLERYGAMPLPPYIDRKAGKNLQDDANYQTVYAEKEGAVAAPTAGLHFTHALLEKLKQKGIEHAFVTLHVGAGTYLPVKVENIADHKMHAEVGHITPETAEKINRARSGGGSIVAVGTTSLRLLESAAAADGRIHPYNGKTDIFITPGYHFKAVDVLMTNFHLPCSTLFMLVCAFAGMERMKKAYAHAVAERYRFFSYGDGSLLFPEEGQ